MGTALSVRARRFLAGGAVAALLGSFMVWAAIPATPATPQSPASCSSAVGNTNVDGSANADGSTPSDGCGNPCNTGSSQHSFANRSSTSSDSKCVEPGLDTTATPGGNPVAPASAQKDVADLTAASGKPTPTGTVKFFLCSPSQLTSGSCPSGGSSVGGPVAVSAAGHATSATINGLTTPSDNVTGKYCWRAEYTPDSNGAKNYLPTTHTNATTECFTVAHFDPTLTTTISRGGADPGSLGLTTLGDTATLTGSGPTAAQTNGEIVTFKLWGPYAGTPTCAGAPIFTTPATLLNGVATVPSNAYTPTAAGTYVWRASYPGDDFNSAASDACNQEAERTTIVGAVIKVTKSANPPGPVSAGDDIGFDIAVSNTGAGTASNVTVTDNLPAGGGLNWSLSPAHAGCSISGAIGSQVLNCNLGNVHGQTDVPVIHVTSHTSQSDCATISNTAVLATGNAGSGQSTASVQVNCAALTLTKTADAPAVSAGSPIGFTITASNSSASGTGTAKGVVIDDVLPGHAGISWSIASGPANCAVTGSAPNQTLHCTAVDLAPGADESVHVTSQTVFASCATYDNTATLTAANASGKETSAHTAVRCPDLSISKTADETSVDAGGTVGFTITAHNTGGGDATDATITDTLPSGTGISWSVESASGPLTCGIAAGVLTCSGTLGADETQTVHIVSKTQFASCATYDNTATLSSSNAPAPDPATASVVVRCPAVSFVKAADATTVDAGTQIGFTVTATNNGAGNATSVEINDPLPLGSSLDWSLASGPANCSVTGTAPAQQTLVCTAVTLAPGHTITAHVVSSTAFKSCATYDNVATLDSGNSPSQQASADTTVQCPDLSVSKTADAASVSAGEPIGFQIDVANAGPGTAVSASLHDPLPAGTGIDWVISPDYAGPGTCSISGAVGSQVLDCAFGDLADGGTASVHVTSSTQFASCDGTYDNTATFAASNAPAVESAKASTTVQCPDVFVSKDADSSSVDAGSPIGFTVTAGNNGPGTAFAVVIDDPLPSGDGIDWSIESGSANCSIVGAVGSQVLSCSAVDLAAGDSVTAHVVSQTAFASCESYQNTATATATNESGEFTASAGVNVLCSALELGKTADAPLVDAGTTIGFTITLTNPDTKTTGTAKSVTISDPLPAGPDGSGIDWAIDPAYGGPGTCAITGAVGSQQLSCDFGDVGPGADISVHVSSSTEFASCATYDNEVGLAAANAPEQSATASVSVLCPALTLTKSADAEQVASGTAIGFTLTAANDGPGTAVDANLIDPLPAGDAGADVSWAISPDYAGPGICAITGAVGSQLLACSFGSLEAGQSVQIHIVSATTEGLVADCVSYANSATLTADNAPELTADATTTVVCPPAPTTASRTTTVDSHGVSPEATSRAPLASTGAGPLSTEIYWALMLILLGGGMTIVATTRRGRRSH